MEHEGQCDSLGIVLLVTVPKDLGKRLDKPKIWGIIENLQDTIIVNIVFNFEKNPRDWFKTNTTFSFFKPK